MRHATFANSCIDNNNKHRMHASCSYKFVYHFGVVVYTALGGADGPTLFASKAMRYLSRASPIRTFRCIYAFFGLFFRTSRIILLTIYFNFY